jgi:methylated-DNA-[protein]-cysteine S-methyltransferase
MLNCKIGTKIISAKILIPIGFVSISCCKNGLHKFSFDQIFREKNSIDKSVRVVQNLQFKDIELIECLEKDHDCDHIIQECLNYLRYYFFLSDKQFDLPSICWNGISTCNGESFSFKVMRTLVNQIKIGQTISYRDLSRLAGKENAQRAVGSVMRRNQIVLIIPCHRVINSNKRLVNYNGGVDIKEWLLDHEKRKISANRFK